MLNFFLQLNNTYPHLRFTIILLKVAACVLPFISLIFGVIQSFRAKSLIVFGSFILATLLYYLGIMVLQEILSMILDVQAAVKKRCE